MRDLSYKTKRTSNTHSIVLPVEEGRRQAAASHPGESVLSPFAYDFSRIPVHSSAPPLILRKTDAALPAEADNSAADPMKAADRAGKDSPPEVKLSLSEKLKLFRYLRKRERLQRQKSLTGEKLKAEMDRRYQFDAWYYVPQGGFGKVATNAWSPISDFASESERLADESTSKSNTLFWLETSDPFAVELGDGTGTITIRLISDQQYPDVVRAEQRGRELSKGTFKAVTDSLVIEYDAKEGDRIELTLDANPENIRNTENPTADPAGSVWAPAKFQVTLREDQTTNATQLNASMRIIGPYSGPLRRFLKEMRQAGTPPLIR